MATRRSLGLWMAVWGGLILLIALFWKFWMDRPNYQSQLTEGGRAEITLKRGLDNHFQADVSIAGKRIRMLVDTGATYIALPQKLAQELNLQPQGSITLGTAAGPQRGSLVMIPSVSLGDITLYNVKGVTARSLSTPLLGMSFLGKLEMKQAADVLILTGPAARH